MGSIGNMNSSGPLPPAADVTTNWEEKRMVADRRRRLVHDDDDRSRVR